jgi:hypothetical protein
MTDEPLIRGLGFVLPLRDENRWSDLLATLITIDPEPVCRLLGLDVDPATVRVEREVVIDPRTRADIVLHAGDHPLAVLELKVLAGLGVRQLERTVAAPAVSGAQRFVLVSPHRLAVDSRGADRWSSQSWEDMLDAHARSRHPWVTATAGAWLAHLERSLPVVGPATVWDEAGDDEDFILAMRARMTWLHHQLDPPPPVEHDLVSSAAGASPVVRLFADTPVPGFQIMVDVEERQAVQELTKARRGHRPPLLGPRALVALLQNGVSTSADFDWEHLRALWPVMAQAPFEWSTRAARPKAEHDRAAYAAMVARGGPPHLGFGFGEAQARRSGACMFGARVQFPPDIPLGRLAEQVRSLGPLVAALARVEPPSPSRGEQF